MSLLSQLATDFEFNIVIVGNEDRVPIPKTATQGPRGHSVHTKSRCVYVEGIGWNSDDDAEVFHEIMHVIVQPPWLSNADQYPNEGFLLLTLERLLAAEIFTRGGPAWKNVLEYQESTDIAPRAASKIIGLGARPTTSRWWTANLRWLKYFGMLSDDNRVVRQPFPWRDIDVRMWKKALDEVETLIEKNAKGPPWAQRA